MKWQSNKSLAPLQRFHFSGEEEREVGWGWGQNSHNSGGPHKITLQSFSLPRVTSLSLKQPSLPDVTARRRLACVTRSLSATCFKDCTYDSEVMQGSPY